MVTGPGWFVARDAVIDDKRVPTACSAAWPEIRPNGGKLSRFIHDGNAEWLWRVSAPLTIGRARRSSGWLDNWFVLCRTPMG